MKNFKAFREKYKIGVTEISRYFGIPLRTVQNWEYGVAKCPPYLLELMAFKIESRVPPIPPEEGQ